MTSPAEHHVKELFLDRVKYRASWGASKPALTEIFKQAGQKLEKPIIAWHHYAGMGDYINTAANEEDAALAREFITAGLIVPTFQRDVMDMEYYTELKHIDDVNWGRNAEGQLVFYELSQNPHYPDIEDICIPLDKKHKKVMDHVVHHLGMGSATEDDPITLKSGEIITPIIMGYNDGGIRQRQKGILPSQLETGLKPVTPFT